MYVRTKYVFDVPLPSPRLPQTRLSHFRIGCSLDKAYDMGPLVSKDQLDTVSSYVESAREEGAEVFQVGGGGG